MAVLGNQRKPRRRWNDMIEIRHKLTIATMHKAEPLTAEPAEKSVPSHDYCLDAQMFEETKRQIRRR